MKSYIIAILVIVLLAVVGGLVYIMAGDRIIDDKSTPSPSVTPVPTQPNISDMIYLETPQDLNSLKSPLVITGRARGNWYFEASFPVKVLDASGNVLVQHYAEAQSDWMTTEFVPFKSTLIFSKPPTPTGTLVLEKDNPSGLPEHSAELRIPVSFDMQADYTVVSECKVTGCSGQICADENVVTTCEYKEEYACYKTAKCERQESGECGWTPTEELVTCLAEAFQTEEIIQ